MKLEEVDLNKYIIFLNYNLICSFNSENEDSIRDFLKKLFVKLMKIYKIKLGGYYQVDIYLDCKIGMFIELEQLDDYSNLSKSVDLKITIDKKSFYLKFKDLEMLDKYKKIYIKDDGVYIKSDEIKNSDILKLIEFGKVIYKEELEL